MSGADADAVIRFDPRSREFRQVQKLYQEHRPEEARELLRTLVSGPDGGPRRQLGELDERVADLIEGGASQLEIARRLEVNPRTVVRWAAPKKCPACDYVRPIVAFDRDPKHPSGRVATCRRCVKREETRSSTIRRSDRTDVRDADVRVSFDLEPVSDTSSSVGETWDDDE